MDKDFLKIKSEMTPEEIESNLRLIKKLLDVMGVPHFMIVSYVAVESDPLDITNHFKCKCSLDEWHMMLRGIAVSEDKYLAMFIALGEQLKEDLENGKLDILRNGLRKSDEE